MNKKKTAKKHISSSSGLKRDITSPLKTKSILKTTWLFPFVSLAVLIIVLSLRKISNFDVGIHLASGRWIVENLTFPYKDIFTYTVTANEYIDVLWLYQVLIYFTQNLAGYTGLTILNSLMILLVFYLIFKRMKFEQIPYYISLIILIAAVFAMQVRFSYRPEIVTWIFILLTLYILDKYRDPGNVKLFWLPVIMFIWVNMHGLFIIGLIIISAYTISVYYHSGKLDFNLVKWFGVSILAVFINPYFTDGVFFPVYLFSRLETGNIFKDTITELQSPWLMTGSVGTDLNIYYIVTIVSTILFALNYKKRKLHQYILFIAFFFISYRAFRNIPIFLIYSLHISALSLKEISGFKKLNSIITVITAKEKIISIIIAALILLVVPRVLTGAFYWKYNSRLVFGAGLNETALPEEACSFINEKNIRGKMLNILEYGGWIEWRLRQPVFIDGRLEVIQEFFYSEYINGLKTYGLTLLLNKYNPDLIINDIGNYVWNLEIKKQQGWKLVYYDNTAVVYVKNYNGIADSFDFLSVFKKEGIIPSLFDDNRKQQLILNSRIYSTRDWLTGFYIKQYMPIELMKMGNFAFDFDRVEAAELFYLEFLHRSGELMNEANYFDVFNNLAAVYSIQKKYSLAVMCYENCLKVKPQELTLRTKITELKKMIK